jgi:5-formyltetrahydrofolate cyclo-ligase
VKQKLRKTKLQERKQQNHGEKLAKDRIIVRKIKRLAAYKKAKKVLFYLPIHGEVNLTALFSAKKTFILPRVKGKSLQLHAIESLTQTTRGKFNIHEPHRHLPITTPQELDLILVPGVVFGEDGHRIGYGKGFYDRLLKKTSCPKIGIAYGFQMVKNIPGQPHDVPMDMIITEQQTLKVGRQKPKTVRG